MYSYNTILYTAITQINDSIFEKIGSTASLFFNKKFLRAFETANPQITHHYLVFYDNKQAIGIAIIQVMDVSFLNRSGIPWFAKIMHIPKIITGKKFSKILVCGNVFLSGAFGIWVKDEQYRQGVYTTLSRKLKEIAKKTKARTIFLKDFESTPSNPIKVVQANNYLPFTVNPNMVVEMRWDSFEVYKQSLRSKYRVKINKADAVSSSLTVASLSARDIRTSQNELQRLYAATVDKASFNAVHFNIETYALLKEHFDKEIIVVGYYLKEKLVGFKTAFTTKNTLYAHFVGIDYEQNKTHAIYQRILNDYLRQAINLNVGNLNLGRTASEIKSTLGATPIYQHCYIKHRQQTINMLLKPLLKQLKETPYKQHTPFKI